MNIYIFTLCLSLAALTVVLATGLLPALLGGLLVCAAIEAGARRLQKMGILRESARVALLVVIAAIVITLLTAIVLSIIPLVTNGQEGIASLLQRMADVVSAAKNYMPAWIGDYLPVDVAEWQKAISGWLRGNAGYLGELGKHTGMVIVHILFGMIIGGFIAVASPGKNHGPLSKALTERAEYLALAFKQIVFSQFKISAVNTTLTGIFLGVILPLCGTALPFIKTMIAVTFIAGLLPVIGNLISNTVIFLIALSVSPVDAVASLVFLVLIHKLEYFLNARIIGGHIKARAWELLLAMLVLETIFGLSGLIAAPIFYAYLKDELMAKNLV